MSVSINKLYFNLFLLLVVIILSLLSIIWHHQTYKLYKQIKHINSLQYQAIALNKQLLSERSQIISGSEIKFHAINVLKMKEAEQADFGKWFNGNLSL
jgi:cell division protein FtsL